MDTIMTVSYTHLGVLVTNRLVTFKAGRFIPEENYAKEIRFDFAPYANYDNNEHPELERYYLGADGLPVTGWQTINGNRYFFQDDGNMVVHRFFNNYYFYELRRCRQEQAWQPAGIHLSCA